MVGEELQCAQEPSNISDPYEVAVEKGIPLLVMSHDISFACSLSLRKERIILQSTVARQLFM